MVHQIQQTMHKELGVRSAAMNNKWNNQQRCNLHSEGKACCSMQAALSEDSQYGTGQQKVYGKRNACGADLANTFYVIEELQHGRW